MYLKCILFFEETRLLKVVKYNDNSQKLCIIVSYGASTAVNCIQLV